MNFSINKMLKKRLSLVLALVMILSLFAGCKKDDASETQPESTPGLNINLNDATVPAATEETTTPTETTEASENMATAISRINVRAKPAVDAVIVYTLEAGDRFEIERQQYVVGYNWGYTPSVGGGGWVVMDFVEMDNKDAVTPNDTQTPAQNDPSLAPTEDPNSGDDTPSSNTVKTRVTVTADELKIRSEGSTSGKVLGVYKKGDTVTVTETKNGWGKTDKGWISMDYVTTGSVNTNTNTNTNNNSTNSDATIESNGSTTVVAKGIVKSGELNVRSKPSTSGDKLTTLKYGARVEILQTSGNWGRTSKGWIHMDYVYKDGTTGKNTDSGTVTGNELNIRSGPGTEYASLGHYDEGDRVKILEQFTYGKTTWGCTNKGWISLSYVDLDSDDDDDDDDDTSSSDGKVGWITAEELNIREGAGSSFDSVGSYLYGDKVTILDTEGNWGKTDKGWISLNFVDFKNAPNKDDNKDDDKDDEAGPGIVVASELRIRKGPGTNYEVVGSFEYGDKITILEVEDGWGETKYGWVNMDYVDMDY